MGADNQVTLRPPSRFDFNSFSRFRSDYEVALVQAGVKCVRVDLQEVQYIDSAALGILLLLRDKAAPLNIKVDLANISGTVKDVLEIANFHKIFTIS